MIFDIFFWSVLPVAIGLGCFAYIAYGPGSAKSTK